jgi:thymidylate synthase (FAD)
MRHRTASINEISGRYSQLPEEFHIPAEFRGQSKVNHQGSEGVLDSPESMVLLRDQKASCEQAFEVYQRLLDHGVARETAGSICPCRPTPSSIGR